MSKSLSWYHQVLQCGASCREDGVVAECGSDLQTFLWRKYTEILGASYAALVDIEACQLRLN
jgi:hypothetical protein